YRNQRSKAFVIYADNTPVGMALYYDIDECEAYDFSQFFIDSRYQKRGYGITAANMILDMMKKDGRYDKVYLCYIDGNDAARCMYEKLGFKATGEEDEDEIIMVKELAR
nr:GNAT family N-acetyltransferase [Lachnospiraceae bacterium]